LAAVEQATFLVVIAEEQCAEIAGAAAGWVGVAADHEFLTLDAFDLQPGERAALLVFRVGALGDDALDPGLAGGAKGVGTVALNVIAVLDRAGGGFAEELLQEGLSLEQVHSREVVTVAVGQVEDEICELALVDAAHLV